MSTPEKAESPAPTSAEVEQAPVFIKSPEELELDKQFSEIPSYEEFCKSKNKEPSRENWENEDFDVKAMCVPPRNIPYKPDAKPAPPDFDALGKKNEKIKTGGTRKNRLGETVEKFTNKKIYLSDEDRLKRKKRLMELLKRRRELAEKNQQAWEEFKKKVEIGQLSDHAKFEPPESLSREENGELMALCSSINWNDKQNRAPKKKTASPPLDPETEEDINNLTRKKPKIDDDEEAAVGYLKFKGAMFKFTIENA